MYTRLFLFLLLLTGSLRTTLGQEPPVTIGSKCPDVVLGGLVNYPRPQVRISDFKGQLLILDFWATYCAPCVAFFKKGDSLQRQFKGQLTILPVAAQDRATVSSFFKKMNQVIGLQPPSVTGDSVLNTLFPHGSLPHYVWINREGVVVAITGSQEITTQNIEDVLGGKKVSLYVKAQELKYTDTKKELFRLGIEVYTDKTRGIETVEPREVLYFSSLTRYREGLSEYMSMRENRVTGVNASVMALYKKAFGRNELAFLPNNRVFLDVRDTSLLTTSKRGAELKEWYRQNAFCYEIRVPPFLADRLYYLMQEDLNRYFGALYGMVATREKRMMKCLALQRTGSGDKLATRGGKWEWTQNAFYYKLKNVGLNSLMIDLISYHQQHSPYPLLDETGYTGNVDLELQAKLSDMNELNRALQPYGLQFVPVDREIDVIVIRDKMK